MDVQTALEIVVACIAVFSAFGGFVWGGLRLSQTIRQYWTALSHLHEEFGDDPIRKLSAVIRDIEASYGELEIRRRIIERHLEIGIYTCSPTGEYIWVNDVLAESFGMDSTEITGNGWVSAVAEEEQERIFDHWKRAVNNNLPYADRYLVRTEHREWMAKTEAWPVVSKGRLLCYVGYVVPDR